MDNVKYDVRAATYAEIRLQTDILTEIANSLMQIESHLCKTPLREITNELITANRYIFINANSSE